MYMTLENQMLFAIMYPMPIMSTGAMYPTDMYAKCDTRIVNVNPQSVIDRQLDR